MVSTAVVIPSLYSVASHRLGYDASVPFAALFFLLGLPILVETNSERILKIAEDVFGKPLTQSKINLIPRLRMRLIVDVAASTESDNTVPVVQCRANGNQYVVYSEKSVGVADRATGVGLAFLNHDLLAYPWIIEQRFLEGPALFLASKERPASFHAATIVMPQTGRGVLLTGKTTAGKSTTCYACLRAGFKVMAEDETFAATDQQGAVRLFGNARYINLRANSTQLFPELANCCPSPRVDDDPRIRVRLSTDAVVQETLADGVLFLKQASLEGCRITAANPAEIYDALTQFDHSRPQNTKAMCIVAERLLRGKIGLLELGNPHSAPQVIKEWLAT